MKVLPRSRAEALSRSLPNLLLLAIAGLTLSLALPRLAAGLRLVATGPALERLAGGRGTDFGPDLLLAEAGVEASLALVDSAEPSRELGVALLRRARRLGLGTAAAGVLAARAEQLLDQAIARSPADPDAWFSLALAGVLRAAAPAEIVHDLLRSGTAGPAVSYLAMPRLSLALAYWPALDTAGRELALTDAAMAYRRSPKALAELIVSARDGEALVQALPPELQTGLAPHLEHSRHA